MYFMLLACVLLLMGVTSCSQNEFENYELEQQKKYSKAELIEQALSRMPQTRAENQNAIIMVSIQDTVTIRSRTTEEMTIYWDGKDPRTMAKGTDTIVYIFDNGKPSHNITIVGSGEAIGYLDVDNNGLILLSASRNSNLLGLSCAGNYLDEINLTGCSSLYTLDISNNEFTSINISNLPALESFFANHNRLTELNFSGNPELYMVEAEYNPLKELDFQENPMLMYLYVSFTRLERLNLTNSIYLTDLYLEETPIKEINNHSICDTSFAMYKELWQLNIAYTSFSSIDLSNTMVYILNISGTKITRLDISGLNMQYLYATRSQLTDLIYDNPDNLKRLYELRIERTPFEQDSMNMINLVQYLPSRTEMAPGHLYTYYSGINDIASDFARKYWHINR